MKPVYWTKLSLAALLATSMVALGACGGPSNVAGPSAQAGTRLLGTVVGASAFVGAGSFGLRAPAGASAGAAVASSVMATVTVYVQENPAITATVAPDGTFTLRGLPEGTFTLVFVRDGATVGTLAFTAVRVNQEITIKVDLSGATPILLEEKRDGVGHGDVEIEGLVEAVLLLSPLADSRFTIDGRTVVARPGETSIVEGSTRRTVEDVTVGRRVHVKATWQTPAAGGAQEALAREIRLQGPAPGATPSPTPSATPSPTPSCVIQGGVVGSGIELQGTINSGSSSSFMLAVAGGRASVPVSVLAGSASFECTPASGPNAPTPAQCLASVTAGAQVHVRGTLSVCSTSAAEVAASLVRVQK